MSPLPLQCLCVYAPQGAAGPLLSPQQLSAFCPETLVVAGKYQADFEKFGIHLRDKQQRAQVAQLLALNQHFPALFNATLVSTAVVYVSLAGCLFSF